MANCRSKEKINYHGMLEQIEQKQLKVAMRKKDEEEKLIYKFYIKNEEEALKEKERQQKQLREKKRLEFKKKNVIEKILRHQDEILKRRQ